MLLDVRKYKNNLVETQAEKYVYTSLGASAYVSYTVISVELAFGTLDDMS